MFIEEKITPGIVCKLSANDMKCLGISNRSDMMALRMECVLYGNADDECQSIMPCRQFEIPKQILEDLLNADFKISDISKMLSISESTVYRRNMMALRMECVLYGNADDECQSSMPCRQFEIPKQILEDLLDADFKISDISKMLSISESTVYRRMRQFELSKMTYSDVDSHVVEKAVKEIVSNCGERTIQQLLGQQHIKIPRLRNCLHQVDVSGVKDRSHRKIHRRVYEVPGPNHLWHVDTNHKLIRWHFIVAGGIDGFSRLVTFLKCTDNNKADTVFKCFQKGVHEFGVPLRVRTDMGMENVGIADFMIQSRGFECILTGKSTHNQIIERLWRDVYDGVLCFYHTLFHFMEDESVLDILIDIYITALHYVFLPKINGKLQVWQQAWAGHRIRTVKSSPIRLFTAGLLNSPVEMALDFPQVASNETESRDEEGSPRPIFSSPLVFVNDNCKSELHLDIPKHWESSNFGVDIFLKAIAIIQKHIENS